MNNNTEVYLKEANKVLACICNIDKNGNAYDHVFYLCDKGKADSVAWNLEIKKMEDIALFECTVDEAEKLGFDCVEHCYNYEAL